MTEPANQPGTEHQHLVCPECRESAVHTPPTSWTPAWGPAPAFAHPDGEPLCPVVGADGYQPAEPVAADHSDAEVAHAPAGPVAEVDGDAITGTEDLPDSLDADLGDVSAEIEEPGL